MEDVELGAVLRGDGLRKVVGVRLTASRLLENLLTEDDGGPLRRLELRRERVRAAEDGGQGVHVVAGPGVVVEEVEVLRADEGNVVEGTGAPGLADACVDERGLEARIGADEEDQVGLLQVGDAAVEEVVVALVEVLRGGHC